MNRLLLLATMVPVLVMILLAPPVADAADGKPSYRVGDRLVQPATKGDGRETYQEVQWDALIPADWDPMRFFKGIDLGKLNDSDPRAMDALDRLRREWDNAPVKASLNGARIRIPGFIVPLDSQKDQLREFLLVPYFGACIHVPPPPANQVIHVLPAKPLQGIQAMDAVWVSGVIETTSSATGMGHAGYRMKANVVAPYRQPAAR